MKRMSDKKNNEKISGEKTESMIDRFNNFTSQPKMQLVMGLLMAALVLPNGTSFDWYWDCLVLMLAGSALHDWFFTSMYREHSSRVLDTLSKAAPILNEHEKVLRAGLEIKKELVKKDALIEGLTNIMKEHGIEVAFHEVKEGEEVPEEFKKVLEEELKNTDDKEIN